MTATRPSTRTTLGMLAVTLAVLAACLGAVPAGAASPTGTDLAPSGLATDSTGHVYIADSLNAVVYKVDPAGTTTTVVAGIPNDPGLPTPGPATSSKLGVPSGLAVDSADNLYIADTFYDFVAKVTPSGVLSIVAGVPGEFGEPFKPGPATSSQLRGPSGLATDADGNLFISDMWHAVVGKVDAAGDLSAFAGVPGVFAQPTPNGPAVNSHLYLPMGLARDGDGNLYIADAGNHVVEKVDASGTLSVVAGIVGVNSEPHSGPAEFTPLRAPTGVALDGLGHLYIADATSNVVAKVDLLSGGLSIVAGNGSKGAPTPGPATESRLDGPADLAVDSVGNLYIADSVNNLVLKVDPSGELSIFAGTGEGLDLTVPTESVTCDGMSLRGTLQDVTVPAGKTCKLRSVRVNGNLTADGAQSVIVQGSTIDGDLEIKNSAALTVTDSQIGNDAIVEDNTGPLTFQNNTVGGNLVFRNNAAFSDSSLVVLGNTVARSVVCRDNDGLTEECNAGGVGTPEPENNAPVASDDAPAAVAEDAVLTVAAPGVLGNDSDADGDALRAVEVSGPTHGSLALDADGSFTYTPDANFAGEDTFTYRATDGEDSSGLATVRLTVSAVNDRPTIAARGTSCAAGGSGGTFALTVADVETAAGSLAVTATSVGSTVSRSTLSGSGASRILALTAARTGNATVTVKVSDGGAQATVPIAVRAAGNGADTVAGTGGLDLLLGGNGGDALSGLGGSDVLCGGNGIDRLHGGAGADHFSGGSGNDVAVDLAAAQGDTHDGTVP